MLDKIMAAICLGGLILFMGWVNIRVMEPDLWLVSIAVLAIAIIYFWKELREGGSHLETDTHPDTDHREP